MFEMTVIAIWKTMQASPSGRRLYHFISHDD